MIRCCNHLLSPLAVFHQGKKYPIEHRQRLIIQAVAIGVFTCGIGGVLFFYLYSAYQKNALLAQLKKKVITPIKKTRALMTSQTAKMNPAEQFLGSFHSFTHRLADLGKLNSDVLESEFNEVLQNACIEKIKTSFPDIKVCDQFPEQNRYHNILPWEHTRVKLSGGHLENDYINASWVMNKKYIAAEGPTAKTALAFWSMVFEHDISYIIMLNNTAQPKGYRYWPSKQKGEISSEHHSIRFISQEVRRLPSGKKLFCRAFDIQFSQQSKSIWHYQLPGWPDFGVISAEDLYAIIQFINKQSASNGPFLVHCSAGVGRTGTYLTTHYLLSKEQPTYNLAHTVARLRLDRPHLVQTSQQYELIARTLASRLRQEEQVAFQLQKQLDGTYLCVLVPSTDLLSNFDNTNIIDSTVIAIENGIMIKISLPQIDLTRVWAYLKGRTLSIYICCEGQTVTTMTDSDDCLDLRLQSEFISHATLPNVASLSKKLEQARIEIEGDQLVIKLTQ